MKSLVFATNNAHKLEEIQKILDGKIKLLSLRDIECHDDIPETANTLEGNASQKSHYIFDKYGVNCFADDTGLEVESLHGEPGVFSARYAGENHDSEANMNKLLLNLKDKKNRKAQFRTIISLIEEGEEKFFEGIVRGHIIEEKRGTEGFGYDPIFVPEGYEQTFAELGADIKNRISHRAKAIAALCQYLSNK